MSKKNQNINELLEFEARCPDFTTEDMYVSALFWKGKGSKRVQKNLDLIATKETCIENLTRENEGPNWTVERESLINAIRNAPVLYYLIQFGENGYVTIISLEDKWRMYEAITKGSITQL